MPGDSREARSLAEDVAHVLGTAEAPSSEQVAQLQKKIAARQREVGYADYKSWMEKVGPPC